MTLTDLKRSIIKGVTLQHLAPTVKELIVSDKPLPTITLHSGVDQIMHDWFKNCGGPLTTGRPCSMISCPHKVGNSGEVSDCGYAVQLKAFAGTYDPNEAIRVSHEILYHVSKTNANTALELNEASKRYEKNMQRLLSNIWFKVAALSISSGIAMQFIQSLVSVL